jgi:hypothetical protein
MQTTELKPTSPNNSETITLQYPISADGALIEQLTLRRPLVRDRLIAEKTSGSEVEKEIRLLANLCELPPQHIELLDMADYVKLQECLAGFLS